MLALEPPSLAPLVSRALQLLDRAFTSLMLPVVGSRVAVWSPLPESR